MSTLKPFYVTLTYSAVVMAASERDAERAAERDAFEIVSDQGDPALDSVVEVKSLAHLKRLDSAWEPDCCANGGDKPRLRDVLPEEDPAERDTKTVDMFAAGGAA
jgi:hypothetical protein